MTLPVELVPSNFSRETADLTGKPLALKISSEMVVEFVPETGYSLESWHTHNIELCDKIRSDPIIVHLMFGKAKKSSRERRYVIWVFLWRLFVSLKKTYFFINLQKKKLLAGNFLFPLLHFMLVLFDE